MVRAFAGDSTMIRLSAMSLSYWGNQKEKPRSSRGSYLNASGEGSVRWMLCLIEYQVLHPRIRQLLARLTRQHHEDDPFDLIEIQLLDVQRQQAIDDDLALTRRQ